MATGNNHDFLPHKEEKEVAKQRVMCKNKTELWTSNKRLGQVESRTEILHLILR